MDYNKEEYIKHKKEQLADIKEKLKIGILNIMESEKYKSYLSFLSKFHSYSFNNCLLISMQKPDATFVAGFTSWKINFNRLVKKGEKGIKILAPIKYIIDSIDETSGQKIKIPITKFKITNVFDISQTTGEDIPKYYGLDELQGDIEDFEILYNAIKNLSPVPVYTQNIQSNIKGYFNPKDNLIIIKTGLSQMQSIKTLLHEITHALLHCKEPLFDDKRKLDRNTKELEAESIAYVVCQYFNIDTSDYSFPYLASWSTSKNLKELSSSLTIIQKTSDYLIQGIFDNYKISLTQRKKSKRN